MSVYAALVFFRNPATWGKTSAGKKAHTQMMECLKSLNEADKLEVERNYKHSIVAEMRKDAGVPVPGAAAADSSGSAAASSGSAGGPPAKRARNGSKQPE